MYMLHKRLLGIVLLLFLFLFPCVDIWLLLQLSRGLPFSSILILCGFTAVVGLWIIRIEDFSVWTLLETEIQNGRRPTEELLEAIIELISGISLLLPGFFSDAIGITLLFPLMRLWCMEKVFNYLEKYWNL